MVRDDPAPGLLGSSASRCGSRGAIGEISQGGRDGRIEDDRPRQDGADFDARW